MQHASRIIYLISLAVSLLAAAPSEGLRPAALAVHDATPAQEQQLARAIQQFEAAGLPLPPMQIGFHDAAGPCEGHPGLYRRSDGIADIDICRSSNHVILHELAHAWEGANVDDAARERFSNRWGLDNWNDHSAPWDERGVERAADTVAFVLDGIPTEPTESLRRFLCGYPLLTGRPLPLESARACES